ncbi:MAG TPA: aminoglycoside phosphotransferase family protein [Pyrinomonadaceae bacterium]|nr:aminoglycoside phosphotransferase family protein [Pyrinomonadaceae bacterium]
MGEKDDRGSEIRHYRRLAQKIVRKHFGTPATRIVYRSSGRTNYVFAINHVEGQFIVRISPEPERIKAFLKERWITGEVRKVGVPSSEVLAVGNDIGDEPYMITRRVTGVEATHHPRRNRIIQEMGRFAAMINSIKTTTFGADFDWSSDGVKHSTWNDYLKEEFHIDERLNFFEKHRMLPQATLDHLIGTIEATRNERVKPALNHSDLRLKNVIVDDDGEIAAIIDWEECISTIAPQWELSIALHDLSIDEKQLFIEGYGLNNGHIEEMAPLIKAFNIVNYHGVAEAAIQQNDQQKLAEIKLRLNGALDLYSLCH